MKLLQWLVAVSVCGGVAMGATETAKQQPVLILLYTRIDDHIHIQSSQERIVRLLASVAEFRKRHPGMAITPVFQFSGAMTDVLAAGNKDLHLADAIRDAARNGLIEIGYHGGNEPTYRNRPKVTLANESPGDQFWTARTEVAEKFLTQYKDPLTGALDPKRPGGLKRVQAEFGPSALVTGAVDYLGSDAAAIRVIRKYNPRFMTFGMPDPNPLFAIHGFRGSANSFAELISSAPNLSPEIYWSEDVLRSSDTGGSDIRAVNASDGPEKLKALLAKLNRSKPRVLHMEYGDESRYLQLTTDGPPRFHPLVWAYDHPDAPNVPSAVPAFAARVQVDAAYAAEAQTLEWLAAEFFPANPGSGFVRVADLMAMAETPAGKDISREDIRAAAADLLDRYEKHRGVFAADFAHGGQWYFSLSDMFQLLAKSLAGKKGAEMPVSIKLERIHGPIHFPPDAGVVAEGLQPASVIKAAASIAPQLTGETMPKRIPTNAIPTFVSVEGNRLNASQFLKLMAEIYVNPNPNRKLAVRPCELYSSMGAVHPRNVSRTEQGSTWTLRPAPLKIAVRQ